MSKANEGIQIVEHGAGNVYFIQSENGGPIKIGFATDVESRLTALQVSHPHKLRVLCSVWCNIAVERYYHKKYADYRLNARFTRHIIKFYRAVHIAVVGNGKSGHFVFFCDYVKQFSGLSLFAAKLTGAV